MPELVITRPSYETTTRYLFTWNEKVIETARIKKIKTYDLPKIYATKKKLTAVLSQKNPDLVFLNGHGAPDLITGQNSEILIQAGRNENLLKSKYIHALSCETGKILGPKAIVAGAKSYIGYKEPFVFMATKGKGKKPLKDKPASFFLDPAIKVSLSLLNGDSPKTAFKKSQEALINNIRKLASSGKKEVYLIRYLVWNLQHQVCLMKKIKE